MAYTAKFVRARLAADAEYEREAHAIKRVNDWVETPWEWHDKQTAKAVHFPTHGWVPKVAIGGRTPKGLIVPWMGFKNKAHTFLLAKWFVDKNSAEDTAQ